MTGAGGRRHSAAEFLRFLVKVDEIVPQGRRICLRFDGHSASVDWCVRDWLAHHHRFQAVAIPGSLPEIGQPQQVAGFLPAQGGVAAGGQIELAAADLDEGLAL